MPYQYSTQKEKLFNDQGQRLFISIRDNVFRLLALAGAARSSECIRNQSGDSWDMLACLDRMIELGDIKEITGSDCCGQDRVFIRSGD